MKWVWIGLIWIFLAFTTLAAFHAMITIRNMETIKFDDDELDKEDF
jgi:hypothetical protein